MRPLRKISRFTCALVFCLSGAAAAEKPNVLFISVDDLNDWIGCLGGHPQAKTPNIDRLAAGGMLFSNAHCPAPACNPSRTAIMTGISPHKSGLYDNRQKMREILPDAELIPKAFSRHGYWSAGSGKILHYFIDAPSWDEYFPAKESEDPFPRTLYPDKRPLSLPRGGPWQYVETDWGGLDATDEEFGGDWLVSKWIGGQLAREHDKPFFLACGIYRPHEPWFVPRKYFDQFPLEEIQLPPGYREDDLDDLPPAGKRRGPNRYFAHIRAHKQWKRGIQGYLASIAFADAMVGRVIDALEKGPNRDNTIVVLWSDHGWHLGEKQHWQKFTAWRLCTRVPLIVRVPKGTAGLAEGTRPGSVCDSPVNLLSLFPTLLELAGLPPRKGNDGPSLVPLLRDPGADWNHVSLTHLHDPGSWGLSAQDWRLIHYAGGDEELYHTAGDPYEWHNLAGRAEHSERLAQLRARGPSSFARKVPPSDESLDELAWHPAKENAAPPSRPDGNPFDVVFINRSGKTVRLHWMDREGKPKLYAEIEAGQRKRQQTRPGAVWLITDEEDAPFGHFIVGDRTAQAVIPAAAGAPAGDSSLEVRVMSFNIKQHNPGSRQPAQEPTHWERRKPVAFDIMRSFSPDIVGLQEPYRPQLDDIREAFPEYDEVGVGRRGGNRDEHCTILYRADRFRADQSGTFWLSDTPGKPSTTWGHFYPRVCTWVRLIGKKSGRGLYVFNTHLDHKSQDAREKAVRLIARRIRDREHKEDLFILTGDFNAGEENPVVTYLKGEHEELSPVPVVDSFRVLHPDEKTVGTGNRFEGHADGEKIDYILVPPGTGVLEASIVRTHKDGLYPSDHFPVTARLQLNASGEPASK